MGQATHGLTSPAPEASPSGGERKNRQNKNSNKNMSKEIDNDRDKLLTITKKVVKRGDGGLSKID